MESEILKIASQIFRSDIKIIQMDSSRDDILGWDSFAHIAFISALEEELLINIPLEEIENIKKIEDVLKFAGSSDQ